MSKRLRDIPTTCPMFDKAIKILENLSLSEEDYERVKNDIDTVIDLINEGRSANGYLRDTCVDIAEEKDKEIESLLKKINELNAYNSELKDEIESLEARL